MDQRVRSPPHRQWSSLSFRNLFRRQVSVSETTSTGRRRQERSTKRAAEGAASLKTAETPSSSHEPKAADDKNLITIPDSVWIDSIFPFLDRWSQNHLAEASRAVFVARHHQLSKMIQWPANARITAPKLPRTVLSLAFSNMSQQQHLVATIARSKKVYVFDKLQGPLRPLSGHTGHVVDAKFSPNNAANTTESSILATAGRNDGTIRLWTWISSASTYECFRVLQSYQNDLRHIVWSPDSQWIAAWGAEGFIRVIRVSDGRLLSIFWKTRLEVVGCHETVVFAPDSQSLAYAYNNEVVRLWKFAATTATDDTIRILPGSSDLTYSYDGTYITSIAYSPDHQYLAVGCHVSTVRLWAVTPVPAADGDDNDSSSDSFYYDFKKNISLGAGWSAVTLLQFTPDSRYIACTGNGAQIRLIQASTGMVVGFLNGHSARVEALCFSPHNDTNHIVLASGGRDRSIRLWRM